MGAGTGKKQKKPLFQQLKTLYPEISEKSLYSSILCGEVRVDGGIVRDPKLPVKTDTTILFEGKKFVSRGGEKLSHALKEFGLETEGKVFVDAGSSTGGFSHCLLLNGASMVHAVDVGHNQLDYSLRADARIVVHEKTNIMDVHELDPRPQAAVADLSFRSIKGAASHLLALTTEKWLVALIKPQFEWKNPDSSFNGIVSGDNVIRDILKGVVLDLEEEGAAPVDVTTSPIPGRKGNREFLFLLEPGRGLGAGEVLLRLGLK